MLPRVLRKSTPQSVFAVVLYALPLIVLVLINTPKAYNWSTSSIFAPYFNPISATYWLTVCLGIVLLVLAAVYTQYVFNKYRLLDKANQFPFILTLALIACSSQTGVVSPWSIGVILLIRLLDRSMEIQRLQKPNAIILEASFTAGTLWLLSSDFIWVYPIILLAYLYGGNLQPKGFVISIFGFFLPYYFMISVNYLLDFPVLTNPISSQIPNLSFYGGYETTLLLGCLLVVFIGFRYFFKAIVVNKIIIKNHLVLLLAFSVLLVIATLFSAHEFSDVVAAAFPSFSVLAGLYFLNSSKTWLMETTFFAWYFSVITYLYLGLG